MENEKTASDQLKPQNASANGSLPKKDMPLWALLKELTPAQFWTLAGTVLALLFGCAYLGYRWADYSASMDRKQYEIKLTELNNKISDDKETLRVWKLKLRYLDAVTYYYSVTANKDGQKIDGQKINEAKGRLVQLLKEWWPPRDKMPELETDEIDSYRFSKVNFPDGSRYPVPDDAKQSFHKQFFGSTK
jgi:hypothetical protein